MKDRKKGSGSWLAGPGDTDSATAVQCRDLTQSSQGCFQRVVRSLVTGVLSDQSRTRFFDQ